MSSPAAQRRATRVRMVAQPASVPAVRRFVDEALTTWGRDDLVDDIALTVTELATNATLHGTSNHFVVELVATRHGARLAVVDSGSLPAPLIASRAEARMVSQGGPPEVESAGPKDPDGLELESTTGRGLLIVAALASRWGIDDVRGGTRIWADFRTDRTGYDGEPPVLSVADPEPGTRAGAGQRGQPQPAAGGQPRVVPIELLDCPPRLLLAHDDNLADFTRELALFGASHQDMRAVEAARQIAEVVRASALAWDAARLIARQALDKSRAVVDIAIASDPTTLPVKIGVLRRAVRAAEAMAENGQLMTLPAPEPVQRWRDWVEREMIEQAATGRPPRPFDPGPGEVASP